MCKKTTENETVIIPHSLVFSLLLLVTHFCVGYHGDLVPQGYQNITVGEFQYCNKNSIVILCLDFFFVPSYAIYIIIYSVVYKEKPYTIAYFLYPKFGSFSDTNAVFSLFS